MRVLFARMPLNRAHLNVGEQPARIAVALRDRALRDTNINATFGEVLFEED